MAVLLICRLLGLYSRFVLDHDFVFGLVPLFDTDLEGNVPSWYSSSLLLAASGMALLCRHADGDRRRRAYWGGLTAIFLYMSLDEAARLHEQIGNLTALLSGRAGMLLFPWVLPFGILALVVGALYLRFLFRLPVHTAATFVAAGALYVGGALGMEIVQALYVGSGGLSQSRTGQLVSTAEEFMEMGGASLFIYGAHGYLRQTGAAIRLSFA